MKNWIQPGDIVTMVATAAVNSGDGLIVGTLFGVAMSTAAIDTDVEIAVTGVVVLPKAIGAITQGAKVYWDNTAKNITTTATANTLIGCVLVAVANGDATAQVRLNGVVV